MISNTIVEEKINIQMIPSKLINAKLTPQSLFKQIMNNTDFAPVIFTMIQEHKAKDKQEAEKYINGFAQWLSAGLFSYEEKKYLMFHGPVDDAFHCAILNTRWYHKFCDDNFGCLIHHNPFDQENTKKAVEKGGILYTINKIKEAFGSETNDEILKWEEQNKKGLLTFSSVSCPGCDY